MEPVLCMTAWIAVTDANEENGCVSLIPGSHKVEIQHETFSFLGIFVEHVSVGQDMLFVHLGQRQVANKLPWKNDAQRSVWVRMEVGDRNRMHARLETDAAERRFLCLFVVLASIIVDYQF